MLILAAALGRPPEPLSDAPIKALSQGREVKLGMTRAELLEVMGPPPEGFDYGDEMLWAPPAAVWRCFLSNDRVVGIQADCLVQNEQVLIDHDCSKRQIIRRLGAPLDDSNLLVFPNDGKNVVVSLEPAWVGHYVTFMGLAAPGFDTERFFGWVIPISEKPCSREPFAEGE